MREIPKDVALTLISLLIFSSFCAKLVAGVSSTIPWQPVANDNNGQWYPKGVLLWFTAINVIYVFKKNQGWYFICSMLYGKENYSISKLGYWKRTEIFRQLLHTTNFYQIHIYQGIIRSSLNLSRFVSLHQYVFLLFYHHTAYHSEWLSWPCLCNFPHNSHYIYRNYNKQKSITAPEILLHNMSLQMQFISILFISTNRFAIEQNMRVILYPCQYQKLFAANFI